jgi:hypothetical protein
MSNQTGAKYHLLAGVANKHLGGQISRGQRTLRRQEGLGLHEALRRPRDRKLNRKADFRQRLLRRLGCDSWRRSHAGPDFFALILAPILPNTIFPILHLFFLDFLANMCKISYKFVKNESCQNFTNICKPNLAYFMYKYSSKIGSKIVLLNYID